MSSFKTAESVMAGPLRHQTQTDSGSFGDTDMVSIILDIKEKIRKINAEEKQKMPTIKFIPMENIVFLGALDRTNKSSDLSPNLSNPSDPSNNSSDPSDLSTSSYPSYPISLDASSNPEKKKKGKKDTNNNANGEVFQYNILLRRQQQLNQKKQRIVPSLILEGRARELLGANREERMVDEEMQEMIARSAAERYYRVSESDNLLSDLSLESFQKPWGKLEANLKINRLMKYAEKLQTEYVLEEDKFRSLRIILIDAVNNRKITRKNDVQYNEELGMIMDIRGLIYNKETKTFSYESDTKKLALIGSSTATSTSASSSTGTTASTGTASTAASSTVSSSVPVISVKEVSEQPETPQVEQITSLSKEQMEMLSKKKKILVTIKPKKF